MIASQTVSQMALAQNDVLSPEIHAEMLRRRSPSNLSYVTALRGLMPLPSDKPFLYGELGIRFPEAIVAYAASNPNGNFIGFDSDPATIALCAKLAGDSGIRNVSFHTLHLSAIDEAARKGHAHVGEFDFLYHDNLHAPAADAAQIFTAAALLLKAGGIFSSDYAAFSGHDKDAALHYAAGHLAQRRDRESLEKLRQMGALYFAGARDALAALDRAIESGNVDDFYGRYASSIATSRTSVFMKQAARSGLSYLGSSNVRANYLELSAPYAVHPHIDAYRGAGESEAMKDFATCTQNRSDIWVKPGAAQGRTVPERFGGFHFVISQPLASIGHKQDYFGHKIELSNQVYDRIMPILSLLPATLGDLIHHPDVKGLEPLDIVAAVQTLVATGIAEPVRASYPGRGTGDMQNPHFQGNWNQSLRQRRIPESGWLFAAPTLGRPIAATLLMAMTLQAIDKAGVAGAEDIINAELGKLPAAFTRHIEADLSNEKDRRNFAYHLLEQTCREALVRCFMTGIFEP